MAHRLLCIISIVLVLGACQERESEVLDPMDKGYQMIDRGEYDSAIAHFIELLQTNSHPHVKMALASAYAGKAGLRIEKFWDFAQVMRGEPINEETAVNQPFYIKNKSAIEPIEFLLSEENKMGIESLLKVMAGFEAYRRRIDMVPYVAPTRRHEVEKAIEVLDGIPNRGGRMYRAILNGVMMRSELDDGFDVWGSLESRLTEMFQYPLRAVELFCSPITGDLTAWISHQFDRSRMISEDMQIAFPSSAPQYVTFTSTVEKSQEEIPRLQQTLIPGGCGG